MDFKFFKKNNNDINYFSFNIKTLCGESIEFFGKIENTFLKEIFFFSSGSRLNLITGEAICEIALKYEKNSLKEKLNEFWEKFPLKLFGYRKENINYIFENFCNKLLEIN